MKKKLLSILCAICTVFMLVPMSISAEGGTTSTYDLWQVDGKVYYAEAGTRTDFSTADGGDELPDWSNPVCYEFPGSGTYVMQTDITMSESKRMIQFTTSDTTLELNGKTVTSYVNLFSYITAENVTILDSVGEGTINGEINLYNCSLTLKSGTIHTLSIAGGSTFYADGGKIETFREFKGGTITQNNGTAGTEFKGSVNLEAGTISGGVFYGTVNSGTILEDSSTISGGVFYGEVLNNSNSTISGGVFYGGIEDNGGTITGTKHTVSFDLNGASGAVPVTQYFVNTNTAQALEPATEPTREDYEFAGWYNGDTKYDFTQNVTDDITLTAKWVLSKYTVSLNTNGGTINSGNIEEYIYGQGAVLPTDVTKPGYTFAGWYDNETLSGDPVTEISANEIEAKTYWAKWNPKSYTVKFNTAGGNSISDKTNMCWDDKVLEGVPVPVRDGYIFKRWEFGIIVNADTKYSDLAEGDDRCAEITILARWNKDMAPTGTITVDINNWKQLLNAITFNHFFKETQTVTITASDDSGGAVTIEYLLSSEPIPEADLSNCTFTEYTEPFSINPDNRYVIYVRLSDENGNTRYLSSNGIVLDSTTPVIEGIEDGKTYCEAQTVTIMEENIESVTVNGTDVTLDENHQFTLSPADGKQTIVAKDKAGNEITVTVTVKDGHSLKHFDAQDATVTETGTKEYWQCDDCHKYFTDEEATNEIADLEAWKTSEGLIQKLAPEIIKGKGQSVTQGTKKALSFTSNASFNEFKYVKLDGNVLDPKNYTKKEGSIVVTLNSDFVSTLKAGKHTISIVSETGEATTEFEVVKKETVKDTSKNDSSNKTNTGIIGNAGLWISMMVSSLDAMLIGFVLKRKNRK